MTTVTDHRPGASRPSESLKVSQLLEMLGQMMLVRRFEERTMQAYMQQKIGGFCHIYIGQEAVAIGSIAALQPEDPIITAYRDHGHALARGMDPKHAMAELFGKITGCAKGKGGSMHFFDRPHHMYGGHAIVGGQIPLGVGLAFAIQYEKKDNVAVCYFGDGALNQGAFHESMNLAAIWNLPIVFACENNMYSMGTHIDRGTSSADDLSKKAMAYGMRYAQCEGRNVLTVYDCFQSEVHRTRRGEGPCFINIETYRYKGHSMSDPQKYRTKDEVTQYEELDCITSFGEYLVANKIADRNQINALDKQAKKIAAESVQYADKSPEPGLDEMYTDVYAQPYPPFTQGDSLI